MERTILTTLEYSVHPITLHTWADLYTKLWDNYATQMQLHQFSQHCDLSMRLYTFHSYHLTMFESNQIVLAVMYFLLGG
jgi:hypothetical protein